MGQHDTLIGSGQSRLVELAETSPHYLKFDRFTRAHGYFFGRPIAAEQLVSEWGRR